MHSSRRRPVCLVKYVGRVNGQRGTSGVAKLLKGASLRGCFGGSISALGGNFLLRVKVSNFGVVGRGCK